MIFGQGNIGMMMRIEGTRREAVAGEILGENTRKNDLLNNIVGTTWHKLRQH